MGKSDKMLVRIKPYDKRRGHKVKTWGARGMGMFRAGRWYEVDQAKAKLLGLVKQGDKSEHAPGVFDICTRAEATEIARREAYERQKAMLGFDPGLITPPDMAEEPEEIKPARVPGEKATPPATAEAQPKPVAHADRTAPKAATPASVSTKPKAEPRAKSTSKKRSGGSKKGSAKSSKKKSGA